MRKILSFSFVIIFSIYIFPHIYYVSTSGDDNNDGSYSHPFKTLQMALNFVEPGDKIYLRGGVYDIENYIEVSGTRSNPITIMSYPGEWAIFDGSNHPISESVKFRVTGSYLIFKNFTVRNGPSEGVLLTDGASHNILYNIRAYGNYLTGIEIEGGASYNLVENCDSYENFDSETNGEHADGFGGRYDVGPGNIFRYCRAWNNSDDGFDLWDAENSVLIEYSYAYGNGFDRWNVGSNFQGDGNGFKLGPSSPIIHHSIAWKNKRRGFDFNDATECEYVFNNTSYMNPVGFNFPQGNHLLINNLSFRDGENVIGRSIESYSNSWDYFPFLLKGHAHRISVKNYSIYKLYIKRSDFISLNDRIIKGSRDGEGKIPYSDFLKPSYESILKDLGIKLDYPYYGKSPDIGAREFFPVFLFDIDYSIIR